MTKKGHKFNRPSYKTLHAEEWAKNARLLNELSTARHDLSVARNRLGLEQHAHDASLTTAVSDLRKTQSAGKFWLNAALAGWTLAVVLAGVLIVVR